MASSGPFPAFTLSPLALGLMLLPSFVHADSDTVLETVTVSSEQPLADPRLPEVTTATRTRTPARYVPQAIDAVAVKNLDAYGQTDLSQALTGVPGVDASGDTRFDSVSIRGFSAANDLYLDGFRDDMQYSRDLGNIERVEVLKGPAAVLYGRGSSGGIVNRVSKKPQPGLPSSVSARVGSEGLWRLQADLNGSLSDDITVRLNAAQEESDSFRGDALHSRRQLFAPSLNWRLTPALNWLVQYEYGLYDRTPDRGIPGINGRPADVALDTVYGNAARDYIRDETQSLRSRLSYDLNEHWQLRHLLGVIRLDSDFDNTYQTGVSGNRVTRQRWIQDLNALNITSNFEAEGQFTTGPLAHQLLAGIEIGKQKRDPKLYQNASPVPSLSITDPDTRLQYNGAMKINSDNQHRVDTRALYLQDQLSLGLWKLLAGLRYDRFDIDSSNQLNGKSESRSSHSLSPRIGLVSTPLRDHSFYASYSKTFAPAGGGTIGITPGVTSNALDPEYTRQYETGVKSDWLDGKLSSTLSLYSLELYNRRTTDPNDPSRVELPGLQRTRGMELTLTGRLVGDWYARGGLALQNPEVVRAEANRQGKRPANVSRHNGSLFVGFAPENGWYAETGVTAVGQRYADTANSVLLPGYGRWDARAGYRTRSWDVEAAVTNLTDHRYYASATSAAQIQPGAPRAFLLSSNYRF